MAKWLVAASGLLPVVFAAALIRVVAAGPSTWSSLVYLAASRICHQLPARSFHTAGVPWPVCGRCSGLYVGGALGGLLAACFTARIRHADVRHWLAIAAAPTAATLILEWTALAPMTNAARALAGVPLGAVIAIVVISVTASSKKSIG